MKIQNYCKVTERLAPDPSLKEEIMKKAALLPAATGSDTNSTQNGKIRRHINGKAIAGAGIAAALVAGNAALFANLLHDKNTPQTPAVSEIQEVTPGTAHYAQCMQDYYAYKTGVPCTYDFTGMGMDLDYVWDYADYRITLHAAAGDAFQMHFFYDVIPLKGQKYADAETYADLIDQMDYQDWPSVQTCYSMHEEDGSPLYGSTGSDPGTAYAVTNDGENGGEVWHMHSVVYDTSGFGFEPVGFYVQVNERKPDAKNGWMWECAGTDTQDPDTNELNYLQFDFIQKPEWFDACFPPETGLSAYTHIAVTPLTVMLKDDYADNFPYTTWQLEAGQHTGDEAASEDMAHLDEMQADCSMQTAVGEISEQPLDTPTRFAVNLYSDKSVSASTWYYPLSKPVVPEQCFSVTLNSTVILLTTADVKDPQTAESVTESTENAGNYAALMQDYFGGDLDYSEFGQDCDLRWKTDDAEFMLTAIGGDAYHLYYFFDTVIPAEADASDYSLSLLPVMQNQILGLQTEELHAELTGQDKAEDGRQICHWVSSVNYAHGKQFFSLGFLSYALRALPMQKNPYSGQMMPAGEAQMLTADFLKGGAGSCRYLQPDTVIPYNGRDYAAVYVSPFGLRLTEGLPGKAVDGEHELPLVKCTGQKDFYAAYAADNASAAEFQTLEVNSVCELVFSGEGWDDFITVDVEFRHPVDLRKAWLLKIAGTVIGGYPIQFPDNGSDQAKEAVIVMNDFLTACCDEQRDKMRELSLIEEYVRGYSVIGRTEEGIEEEVNNQIDRYAQIIAFTLSEPTEVTEEWAEIRQLERDHTDLMHFIERDLGRSDLVINDATVFLDRIDRVYKFTVELRIKNENGEPEDKTVEMFAARYDGKWYAEPIEPLVPHISEDGKQRLAEYRAKEAAGQKTE